MQQLRRILWCVFALAPLLLASCVTSVEPLSNEETSTFDERLIGVWEFAPPVGEVADEPYFIIVGRKRDTKSTYDIVTVELQHSLSVRTERMVAYSRLGTNCYLSIAPLPEPNGSSSKSDKGEVIILKYEMPDDRTVKLYFPKAEPLENAVENGKLKGKISDSGGLFNKGISVTLSDTPEAIVRFLDENADACFSDAMTFHKTKDAPKGKNPAPSKE